MYLVKYIGIAVSTPTDGLVFNLSIENNAICWCTPCTNAMHTVPCVSRGIETDIFFGKNMLWSFLKNKVRLANRPIVL